MVYNFICFPFSTLFTYYKGTLFPDFPISAQYSVLVARPPPS